MPSRPGLLVLDLDGTLLIGDDPALDHARELARVVDRRYPGAGARLLGAVEAFLADSAESSTLAAPDGYLAARSLALEAGLSDDEIGPLFLAHRARMSSGQVPFHAPDGAAALLAEARRRVRVALVTNAPVDGLPAILRTLGLDGSFDDVIGDAGKPAGLPGLVGRLLEESTGHADFGQVFSVGDIWENDLAPVAARGATTGHIDRHGTGAGSPTHRASTFGGLVPAIREWLTPAPPM